MKYKGLNTQSPYSGSYPPEQTYVCGLILGIVVCPYLCQTAVRHKLPAKSSHSILSLH